METKTTPQHNKERVISFEGAKYHSDILPLFQKSLNNRTNQPIDELINQPTTINVKFISARIQRLFRYNARARCQHPLARSLEHVQRRDIPDNLRIWNHKTHRAERYRGIPCGEDATGRRGIQFRAKIRGSPCSTVFKVPGFYLYEAVMLLAEGREHNTVTSTGMGSLQAFELRPSA